MPVQFEKFIIQPFIRDAHLSSIARGLIINALMNATALAPRLSSIRLISNFCILYPPSPIVWLTASRHETHITSFFSRADVMPAYEKEEISVDSDEARADVERFLRDALEEIRKASDSLGPQWPDEQDLWKLANATGGLFAHANTVVRYIGDSTIGSPASQLSDVLHFIDNHPLTGVLREEHLMALLDALYARILSNVPPKVMINTRKLLLALALGWRPVYGTIYFTVMCNSLHMTLDEAYAAVNHLRSVLYIPRRGKAHKEELKPFHKSFLDYISDFTRSGFSPDILRDARQFKAQCAFGILKEAPDGAGFGRVEYDAEFRRKDESRCQELMMHGILKETSLKMVDISIIFVGVKMRFRRPLTIETNVPDPWGSSCKVSVFATTHRMNIVQHERDGKWEEGEAQDWMTTFACTFCSRRLNIQLRRLTIRSPNRTVLILFNSAGECCVEFPFVDVMDGCRNGHIGFGVNSDRRSGNKCGSTV
jgi:hypothetical protein